MTMRKFLRFFKHFPRYMAYDVRWLVKKISGKGKNTGDQTVPKKFAKVLDKIRKKTGTQNAVKYTNGYYIASGNRPWSFYNITRDGDTVTVSLDGRIRKRMKFPGLVDGTIGSWIGTMFRVCNTGSDAEMFAVRLMALQNALWSRDDDGTYKVYVRQGKQPLRLRYRITYMNVMENGIYTVDVRDSNKGKELVFRVPYDPMTVLEKIPH